MSDHFIALDDAKDDLLASAGFLAENITSSDGRTQALSIIVPLFLERANVDLAAELSNSIEDPFARDKLLVLAAEKCAEIDDDEYAGQLAEAIEDDGMQAQALEKIALQKSAKGEFDKALAIARDMPHAEFVFADLAIRHSAASNEPAAREMLRQIDYPVAAVAALQAIARLHQNSGDAEKAAGAMDEALAAAGEIDHDEERIRAVSEIGGFYLTSGDNASAISTFEKVRDLAEKLSNIHRDLFLVNASIGMMQAGDIERADATLDLVTDPTQAASCLVGFARELSKKGDASEAMEALEEAYSIVRSQRDSEVRDSRSRFAVVRMIAVQFAEFDEPERAIEIADSISNDPERSAALSQIAQVMTLKERPDTARLALLGIRDDAERLFVHLAISDVHVRNSNPDKARAELAEALSLIDEIIQPAARSECLNEIAVRYAGLGETELAGDVACRNLETIPLIKSESSKAIALAKLSETYRKLDLEMGDTERSIVAGMIRASEW